MASVKVPQSCKQVPIRPLIQRLRGSGGRRQKQKTIKKDKRAARVQGAPEGGTPNDPKRCDR
jgi:hypothetical protein